MPPVNSIIAFLPGIAESTFDEPLDRRQFLVGVEYVELRLIGGVCRAGILLHVVFAILRRGIRLIRELRGNIGCESRYSFFEFRAIVREIGPHRQAGC